MSFWHARYFEGLPKVWKKFRSPKWLGKLTWFEKWHDCHARAPDEKTTSWFAILAELWLSKLRYHIGCKIQVFDWNLNYALYSLSTIFALRPTSFLISYNPNSKWYLKVWALAASSSRWIWQNRTVQFVILLCKAPFRIFFRLLRSAFEKNCHIWEISYKNTYH